MSFAHIFVALKPPTLEGALAGSVAPPLACLMNASNGVLVTVLIGVAGAVWLCPVPLCRDAGGLLPLVGLFYLSCIPAAIAERTAPEER